MRTRVLIIGVTIVLIGLGLGFWWNSEKAEIPEPSAPPTSAPADYLKDRESERLERLKQAAIQEATQACKIESSTANEFVYQTYGGQIDEKGENEYFNSSSSGISKLDVVSLGENIRWARYDNNVEGKDFGTYEYYCFDEAGRLKIQSFQKSERTEDESINQVSYGVQFDDSGKVKPNGIEFKNSNPEQMKGYSPDQPPAPRFKTVTELKKLIRVEDSK